MLRSLSHETAHACLTMLGHWPAWLQEGIAQKLSGDSLSAAQMKKITGLVHAGKTAAPEQPQAGLVAPGRRACRGSLRLVARRGGVVVAGFGRRWRAESAAESRAAAAGDRRAGPQAGAVAYVPISRSLFMAACIETARGCNGALRRPRAPREESGGNRTFRAPRENSNWTPAARFP